MRNSITRRDVLAGAAAAVVAGGAVESADLALHRNSSGVGPQPAPPGEELMIEHGVLKRLLLAYRAMLVRLDAGRTVAPGAVTDTAQLIAEYVESFHEGLEEAYVFPRMRAAEPHLVETLLVQHDRGRHLTAAILGAAPHLPTQQARVTLRRDIASFVRMYEPHEAWEDTVVYPRLRAMTPQRTLDELAERFHDLQGGQFGDDALDQMLQRVGGVEQQLGIHDLAGFTPDLG